MASEKVDHAFEEGSLNRDPKMLFSKLINASQEGDLERVTSLIDQWHSDSSISGPTAADLRHVLIDAAMNNHPKVVSYLL